MLIDLTFNSLNAKIQVPELSVVIPVYNESASIERVLKEWDKELRDNNIDYHFIIVNDGSKDESLEIIKSLDLKIIIINKFNSGHGRSIRAGYDFSVNILKSPYILQIDSDGQSDPRFFKNFWLKRKEYDFILGERTKREDGLVRKLISILSFLSTSIIASINLKDPNSPYRLYNINTLSESLSLVNESFDLQNIALTFVVFQKKRKVKTVKIIFPERIGGESTYNLIKIFQAGFNMLFDLYFLRKKLK
jgi:glycosyltransferase involved in cell wall biosynthesis